MTPEIKEKINKTEKFPAQIYKENVLADCFEDAKKYFCRHIWKSIMLTP